MSDLLHAIYGRRVDVNKKIENSSSSVLWIWWLLTRIYAPCMCEYTTTKYMQMKAVYEKRTTLLRTKMFYGRDAIFTALRTKPLIFSCSTIEFTKGLSLLRISTQSKAALLLPLKFLIPGHGLGSKCLVCCRHIGCGHCLGIRSAVDLSSCRVLSLQREVGGVAQHTW